MTQHLSVAEKLLTWLDVERLLKQKTALWTQLPQGVWGVDCFASGMEVRHNTEESCVTEWLSEIFGHAHDPDRNTIRLRIGEASYPIEYVYEAAIRHATALPTYPLWRDVAYLPKEESTQTDGATVPGKANFPKNQPSAWGSGPDLVSFHSFKGGVGRTTALMTYVAACMQEKGKARRRILVVDADLEAPGISLWLDSSNRPSVSFIHFLEALHYPPSGDIEGTLTYFADELRKTSLNVNGMERELFILPCARNLAEIQDIPVLPEHLARNPDNPWQLSDHLHTLGQRLDVDAVFIDLRAGLSELSSPILFDPRIDHFFVSTVARQSIEGTAEVLRSLYAFNQRLPVEQQTEALPTVVLSLLTKELRESRHYEQAEQAVADAYPNEDASICMDAEFLSTLMSIGSLREALDMLPKSPLLFEKASEWASALYAASRITQESPSNTKSPPSPSRQEKAKNLYEVCQAAVFAENKEPAGILATEPLLNLGKQYAKELPNLLMIGAKGAGKTFTYRQLLKTHSWKSFLEKLGFAPADILDAAVFPTLWVSNIDDKPDGEIKTAQRTALKQINGETDHLLLASVLSRKIKDALKTPPASWEDFWDNLIANQMGINAVGLADLNDKLVQQDRRIIFIFDGIEESFDDATNEQAIAAIQALLSLPNRISELEQRHIGVIIFVREDYVRATIRQNSGQLIERFQAFRLQWNAESFVRLAFMLSCQAKIYSDDSKLAESLSVNELKKRLEELWGRKLGREKSKEAFSARWVYTALCDLNGDLQARDLVRFLRIAAEFEKQKPEASNWTDRLLSPESMRRAIPKCSDEKVSEAKQEISPLKNWVELMAENNISRLRVPFSQTEAKLDTSLLNTLKELGIIYEDSDPSLGEERLFLPEIYRSGLGFEASAAGRPRTLALLRRNIGNIPL